MEKQYRRPGKNRQNRELFSGLAIEKAGETYTGEMCRYPVILVTLKSAKQRTKMLWHVLGIPWQENLPGMKIR